MRIKRAANPRRDSILIFIREYYQDHRIAPNIREISSACNITSTSVTNYYLDKLEDEGMIERIAKISRGIKLTDRGMKYAMMLSGVDTNCTCYLCGAPINQNGTYDPDLNGNQISEKKNKQRLKNIPAGVKINHRAGTVN